MASSVRQTLFSLARRAVSGAKLTTVPGRHLHSFTTNTQTRGLLTLRSLTVPSNTHIQCGCRFYSSSAELEMGKVLEKELKSEMEQAKPVKNIEGWTTVTDEANVTLSKTHGNEKISVKFSVNNSVLINESDMPDQEVDGMPQQISKPPFDVDITKGSDQKLRLVCEFNQDAMFVEQDEEFDDDLFGIVEVHFLKGEEKESDFYLAAESMDADMYQVLMDMLDERGIGDQFAQDLMDFSTNYEQSQYINFLKNIQSFVSQK